MNKSLWLIAILPPDQIAAKIRDVQNEIAENFGPKHILKIPVHLTLEPPFRYASDGEADLTSSLSAFFAETTSFELTLKNFGTFRQDVVFIEVEPCLPLVEMQKLLSDYLRAEKTVVDKLPRLRGFTPHITVANRDVSPEQHHQIWREFNTRKFHAKFRAQEISLLQHDGKQWQLRQRFPLL